MFRLWTCWVLVLLMSGSAWAGTPMALGADAQEKKLATDSNQFALDLYEQLRGGGGNLFYSPASLSTALAMAYAGARGQTAEQMAKVLQFDQPSDQLNANFAKLIALWNSGGKEHDFKLDVANALWGQQGYPFAPAFNQLLQKDYGAPLRPVDFRQTEQARHTINQWVQEKTQGKIADLIPSGGIDALTRLVLTNAIYFKAKWDRPFLEQATHPGPFHVSSDKTTQVPMMHQSDSFRLLKGAGFSALEMTYADSAFSMMVFLPDNPDGLTAFEQSLSANSLSQWIEKLGESEMRQVQVTFPKFKMTQEQEMAKVLSRMGMPLAFSSRSDFSGMNEGQEPVFISAVFHKAYVDVNEKGTEAAAATAIGVRATAMPLKIDQFTADHPFFFIIRDNRAGSILFIGRVLNPNG